jgi:hypothetical protein
VPEVHLPHLEDEEHAPEASAASAPQKRRFKGAKLLLEVLLISSGVFLGLMGEQWREYSQHKELAELSLTRLRAEIAVNREAVAKVQEYHKTKLAELKSYLGVSPEKRSKQAVSLQGIKVAFFEKTAWNMALATGALNYFKPDLSYQLSHIYTLQENVSELTRGLTQAMYVRSPYESFDGFLSAVAVYYDDAIYMEPRLLEAYDKILPLLDRALGTKHDAP